MLKTTKSIVSTIKPKETKVENGSGNVIDGSEVTN